MNFVFINPPRDIGKDNIWSLIDPKHPPLGIALLSAIWDKGGHTSQIIDAAALHLKVPEIIKNIPSHSDFIGITANTVECSIACAIASEARKAFPSAKIIMGGVHPTVFHQELVQNKFCDMVVRNEGEIPITKLSEKTPLESIPNLTWRNEEGEVIVNPDSSTYSDLNNLPFPAYEKLPMHLYHSALGATKREPSIGMVTSRGCPGKCTFCFSGMFGPEIRFMSPLRIIQHIQYLQTHYGIREISFYDDTFTTLQKNVFDLCELMLAQNMKLSWSCFARIDTVNPEMLALMKRAGCHQITYGFETVDAGILKKIKKQINPEQFHQAIEWTKEAKINIRGTFMLGNPGDTEASIKKTIRFAKKSGIQFALFNIATPYPGTALYNDFLAKNALLHQNWDLYNLAMPVLKLETISERVVQKYYYRSYLHFYLRPLLISRHFMQIRSFSELWMYLKAGVKIMLFLARNIFAKRIFP